MELVKKIAGTVNRLFIRAGELIGRVVNPVILGILYLVVIGPVSLVLTLRGYDPLGLRRAGGPADGSTCFADAVSGNDTIAACRRQF